MILTLEQEIVSSIGAIVVSFILVQLFGRLIMGIARKAGAKPGALRSLRDVIAVIWILIAVTAVLSITGLATEFTTLTISGIAGVATSLALQSSLSNVISGVLLLHDKAIRLGDEIQFSGIKGKVVQIGLRCTWVKTEEGNLVLIGNSNLSSGPLVNFTSKNRLTHLTRET